MFKDSNLIEKASKGDKNALEQLYKENIKSLYVFVRSKVDTNERAEDICSEAFIKAFENLNKFKGNSSLKSWLYTIAKSIVFDWYAKKKNSVDLLTEDISENVVNEELDNSGNANNISEKLISEVLNKLQDNYKEVLELRFLMNMNIKECADVMGTSTSNIKVLQNRAIKKAREILKEFNI